jgi:hypothetical protein
MSYPNNASFLKDGLAKVVATSLEANPLALTIMRNAESWKGNKHLQPVKYRKNGTFTTFRGLDLLPTSRATTTVNMEFEMKSAAIAVALGGDELAISQSDTSVTDKLRFKLQEAEVDMAEELGGIFYGLGIGDDFNGLENIVDDGTNAATIGGLSKTTYPTLKGYQVAASGGTLTNTLMTTVFNQISDSGILPDMIVCDRTVHALYESIAQAFNQYTALKPGQYSYNVGATSLNFKGIPVLLDPKATAGTMYFLNSKFLKFVAGGAVTAAKEEAIGGTINQMEGVPDGNMANLGFVWSGFKQSYNQSGMVGHIILRGEVVPSDPGRNGKITGITNA